MENLFEDYMAARCLIKSQRRIIEEFKSGERYLKLQKDHRRVTAGYIKEIKKLKLEIGSLNARIVSNRNMMANDYYAMWDECRAEQRSGSSRKQTGSLRTSYGRPNGNGATKLTRPGWTMKTGSMKRTA